MGSENEVPKTITFDIVKDETGHLWEIMELDNGEKRLSPYWGGYNVNDKFRVIPLDRLLAHDFSTTTSPTK